MKNRFAFILILISLAFPAQVQWHTLSEALGAQKMTPKKIMIDFYADWCAPCKTMEKQTYNHAVIAEYLNANYYPVKFDAESRERFKVFGRTFSNSEYAGGKKRRAMHDFTNFMNVNAVPSIVFLDERGQPITLLQGALTAAELEPYMLFIANDEYKKVTTREQWQAFQKKFKSKIKD